MSDLDDLASAARGETPRDPRLVPGYMPPEKRGIRPMVWIALGLGICAVLVLGLLLFSVRTVTVGTVTVGPVVTTVPGPVGTTMPTTTTTSASAPPTIAASPAAPRRPTRARPPLRDIADPYQALDIYHLRRGVGETIEIKARNLSKRGLFVKSVELYAESNDRVPLDNIGFWLPAGEAIIATREVLELSRRLGDDEPIKAVVNEAEFRETAPDPEEVADRPSGTSFRRDVEE